MGNASVVSGGADGSYVIEIDVGSARVESELTRIDSRISALDEFIQLQSAKLVDVKAEETPYRNALHAAIDALNAALQAGGTGEEEYKAVVAATSALYEVEANTRVAETKLTEYKFEKASLEKERKAKTAVVTKKTLPAWCADLTEDATGLVGTIEIPGEPVKVLVVPGHPEGYRESIEPTAADGQLLARAAMTGPQAYFNAAVLPGWQKWLPTYRAGKIEKISTEENTATVTLYDARSTAQNLPVNQTSRVENCVVRYMSCDAYAFEVGDEVVVAFDDQRWEFPTVIGFLHDPKPCGRIGYFFKYDGLIRGMPPDLNVENKRWTGKSVAYYIIPDWITIHYYTDYVYQGWAYFSEGAQFWFTAGTLESDYDRSQNLLDFKMFACRFEIDRRIKSGSNLTFGILISIAEAGPTRPQIDIILRPGTNRCIFAAFDAPVDEMPPSNQSNVQYFTFPSDVEVVGVNCTVTLKVEFLEGHPTLTINGKVAAALSVVKGEGWMSLGAVNFLAINEYYTWPDFIHPFPRIDYWYAL